MELLAEARRSGLRLGIFSDYPAEAKLNALGISSYFETVVCSRDPQVQRFKPNPKGLQVVAQRLGVDCRRTAYIGDRPEIDGVAAHKAGMRSFIIRGCRRFPAFSQLLNETAPARANRRSSAEAEGVHA
jgi:putative hydrolase of the HAD superfamily